MRVFGSTGPTSSMFFVSWRSAAFTVTVTLPGGRPVVGIESTPFEYASLLNRTGAPLSLTPNDRGSTPEPASWTAKRIGRPEIGRRSSRRIEGGDVSFTQKW